MAFQPSPHYSHTVFWVWFKTLFTTDFDIWYGSKDWYWYCKNDPFHNFVCSCMCTPIYLSAPHHQSSIPHFTYGTQSSVFTKPIKIKQRTKAKWHICMHGLFNFLHKIYRHLLLKRKLIKFTLQEIRTGYTKPISIINFTLVHI